jgi:hypothetical protein
MWPIAQSADVSTDREIIPRGFVVMRLRYPGTVPGPNEAARRIAPILCYRSSFLYAAEGVMVNTSSVHNVE